MIPHKPTLNSALARTALDAALAAANADGPAMSIAVVDEGGFPLCLERMDGAGLMTAKVAAEKARTAALLRAPSRVLADRVATDPALLRLTDYLPMAGGLPIMAEGRCIGAIGVSGGTPEQDEQVGQAGLAALGRDHPS
ncbi:GlcG/HbpS family heme-binding protein [Parasphingopyxis lamellibrachiae]|uniref:Glc operon protein GlcG n=1 Tax=Parasphingopyxis lamellibrachiae TaxID=680125 RepID=A0A3D9FG28_9SPHN|nr:heme-binding protein [Parasphingopyxis lamellibrachiae]RED16774.1 glc operon protein GlcG [Parasphingopyxis lamellibrachiae]